MQTESDRLLDLAEEGLYKKVSHIGCSDSKSVGLYSDTHKVHWYCYKCTGNGHRKIGQKSIAELLELQKAENTAKDKRDKSTKDFVSSKEIVPSDAQIIPLDKRDWLYEAGFSDEVIDKLKYNIYYSPSINRIGIRPYEGSNWTQLRSIDGTYPKYLNRGINTGMGGAAYKDNYVILVEDWLSALRLGELELPYICLFGTNLKDDIIQSIKLKVNLKTIYIWLDNDVAGHKGTQEAKRSLEFYTELDVGIISTDKDPKMYTDRQIKDIIYCKRGVNGN